MNLWRFAAVLLLAVTLAAGYAVYDTTERLAGALLANGILSQALVEGDAQVAVMRNADGVWVRVNGRHLHLFQHVCDQQL